jgi:GTP pyrophosphokinase
MRTEFAKLLKQIKKALPEADLDLVRAAYRVADKAHQGQKRLSGDPYITHCISVANILVGLGLDTTTVAAGLLHDVIEDTDVTHEDLRKEFNADLVDLVDGVTKISSLHIAAGSPTREEKQAENLRKMLIATAKDVRIIIIKLADRLHNLRTIEVQEAHKVKRICRETLDIYAPVASRLGLSQWKWELEDHAFHYLHPDEYKETARMVAMKRREREEALERTIQFLEERLEEAEVPAHVIGRPKHLYSIYHKMALHGKTFDQVLDVMAIRIICQTVGGCYNALGLAHHLWKPVHGRFKDYIASPKLNMYQSIHTTVVLEDGKTLEIQIRSEDMDRAAREGIAAHWKYKDGVTKVKQGAENQLQWLRQMYDWLKDAHAPDELFDSLKRDFSKADIYVFTPKGDVNELPSGATPVDFAYMIHSDVGHCCIGARVNGSMVPLRYHLQNGDVVEILTSRSQTPHVDWLDFVVTGRARTRIRQKLRELGELPSLSSGETRPTAAPQIPKPRPVKKVREVDDATRSKLIRVEGSKGMAVQFARCCKPMPGQPVIGYITKRQGISIHRADCSLLEKNEHQTERMIAANWEGDEMIETAMWVSVGARPNVLADITNAMRPMNVEITHAELRPGDNGESVFVFVFESGDRGHVDRVAKALCTVSGVTAVSIMPASTASEATAAS